MLQNFWNTMSGTTINSVLTIISILCTIFSGIYAKRAKKIKESVYNKLDTIDLLQLVEKFGKDYKNLSSKVRSKSIQGDSEEGKKLVALADSILLPINKILPMVDKETHDSIVYRKKNALEQIQKLNTNGTPDINTILAALDEIDQKLRMCADKMKKS